MRTFILSFTLLLATTIAAAQQIRLEEGERFTVYESHYHGTNTQYADKDKPNVLTENLSRFTIDFKVLKVQPDHYDIQATITVNDIYDRENDNQSGEWKTRQYYYKELGNSLIPEKTTVFDLSFDGKVSNTKSTIQDSTQINRTYDHSPDFSRFFFPIPKDVKPGQILYKAGLYKDSSDYIVKEITGDYVTLVHSSKKYNSDYEISLLVNSKGLIIEKHNYEKSDADEYSLRYNISKLKRQTGSMLRHLRTRLTEGKSTHLPVTNITIKGKIKNTNDVESITLGWNSIFDHFKLTKDINEDGTFELHTTINQLQKASFGYDGQQISFYLMPGDDLYLEFDSQDLYNTIQASGIGASHANFMFDKYQFNQKHEEISLKYFALNDQMRDLTPNEVKSRLSDYAQRKIDFLESHKGQLSPEIFLAEYWTYHANLVEQLNAYPRVLEKYAEWKGEKKPKLDRKSFFDFDSLIHPDNDLMRFMENYDNFINNYAYNVLENKITSLTGGGDALTTSKKGIFSYSFYRYRYDLVNSIFTGFTQYILKYRVTKSSLKLSEREIYQNLYKRFTKEYPHTHESTVLDSLYQKALSVEPGEPAYNFVLNNLNGNPVHLSDFQGRVVYINIVDQYSCQSLQDHTEKLDSIGKNGNIEFVYIIPESIAGVTSNCLNELSTKLVASGDEKELLKDKFFIQDIPQSIIIDTEGRIFDVKAPSPKELVQEPQLLLKALDPG